MSSIYLADDHPLIISALERIIIAKGYKIAGSTNDGRKALNFIIRNKPEIAILDIKMPNLTGLEIAEECYKLRIPTRIIIITIEKDVSLYLESKRYNVYGYILKEFALDEIENCIETVKYGNQYFSEKIKDFLGFTNENDSILKDLSKAELRVLELIAKHKTNKEIGELLFISHKTVEKHRSKIILKLGLKQQTNSLLIWVQMNKHLFI